ncbi:PKD domain-containing protein [Actinoplanes xinjiangensis]|uniref:PKD domain-containing protein n=1 Tax=Actinoplanes xinjiangensis TaxID=512350 RepID=UPI003423207C
MKSSLARPVVVAVALLAGSGLVGTPAHAIPGGPNDAPTGQGGATVTEQSVSTLDTVDPGTTDPGTTDPGTTDPGTTDPGTTDPGTTDPGTTEPDTTVPTGSFRLDYSSVWTGQKITVGQKSTEFSDPVDDRSTLKRVVNWGDGTSTVLSPTTESAAKAYNRAGNFKVTVTITDPAGNVSAIPTKTVAVTVPAGHAALSRKSVYQGALFNVNIKKVPAGATKYRIDWSDGYVSYHNPTTKSVTGRVLYQWKWDAAKKKYVTVGKGRLSGVRAVKISWLNGKGYSAFQTFGLLNVVKDNWNPNLTIKKPSSPSRASSWKTITGTVSDKGSGLRHVGVTAFRVTSTGKAYCLTAARKWKRYYTDADVTKYCYVTGVKVKVVKGKWTLKLPAGLGKNQFFAVEAWSYDRADNYRGTYRTAKITRS